MLNPVYVIISPVRNEARHLRGTIDSVTNQTILPAEWIVVDDGSTDESPEMIEHARSKHPWITLVRRADRGARKPGTGVVEAFYEGYNQLCRSDWNYLVKLDGDVTFGPEYFFNCFKKFTNDDALGIGGGKVSNLLNGTMVAESPIDPHFHVRGATKIYRRECWDQLGGLIRAPGWDTLDEFKANRLNWRTYTFDDIELLHHKPAGSADGSWKNWVKNGLANYIVGYHPVFMLCKSAKRLFHKPYGIGAAGLLAGYLSGYLKRVPRIEDEGTIKYLRGEQIKRMLGRASIYG